MGINNSLLKSIQTLVDKAINIAPFDKTRQAQIITNNNDGTYTIRLDGVLYNNIPSYPNCSNLKVGIIIKTIIPSNQTSQMYIVAPEDARTFLDFFYPVGSYYETSNKNFNPNNEWGGTWVLEAEGKVHVSAGSTYTINSTYGTNDHVHSTNNHTLTVAEIPSHGHNVALYGTAGTLGTWKNWKNNGATFSNYTNGGALRGNYGNAQITWATGSQTTSQGGNGDEAGVTRASGGGGSHNHGNVNSSTRNSWQPSIAVNRWHRTA